VAVLNFEELCVEYQLDGDIDYLVVGDGSATVLAVDHAFLHLVLEGDPIVLEAPRRLHRLDVFLTIIFVAFGIFVEKQLETREEGHVGPTDLYLAEFRLPCWINERDVACDERRVHGDGVTVHFFVDFPLGLGVRMVSGTGCRVVDWNDACAA